MTLVKTLHSYLMRQVLATLMMTVAVFTFVLLLGNVLKEIITLLINGQATFLGVLHAFALLIPFVLMFALPMGMLTAALLVFGRFSADQELTAVRSSGVCLVSLVTPILLLSLVLCGVSAWINLEIAPRCRVAYIQLLYQMGYKAAPTLLPEGRITTFPNGSMIYVGHNDGKELQDVIVDWIDRTNGSQLVLVAPTAHIETENQRTSLVLSEPRGLRRQKSEPWAVSQGTAFPLELDFTKSRTPDKKLSDMTYHELTAQLRMVESRFSIPTDPEITIDQMHKLRDELEAQTVDLTTPIRVQMHRQVAFSFACFGFTLVGIPLGIRAHRRETNAGFAMALGLVLVYYSFIVLGQSLQTHSEWAPYLIVWLPNFIFQAIGAVMLWSANNGN
jgi:lipopolysaccharide export system permease protein